MNVISKGKDSNASLSEHLEALLGGRSAIEIAYQTKDTVQFIVLIQQQEENLNRVLTHPELRQTLETNRELLSKFECLLQEIQTYQKAVTEWIQENRQELSSFNQSKHGLSSYLESNQDEYPEAYFFEQEG